MPDPPQAGAERVGVDRVEIDAVEGGAFVAHAGNLGLDRHTNWTDPATFRPDAG